MDADGDNPTQVTTSGLDETPEWSPDGTSIVFMSTRDGDPQIYTIAADGTGETAITADAGEYESPFWQPSVDAPTLPVVPVFGNVTDHTGSKRDVIDVTVSFAFGASSDGTLDPANEDVDIEVGPSGETFTLHIPSGSNWKLKKGEYTYSKAAAGGAPAWSVKINPTAGKESVRVLANKFDFAAAITNPVLTSVIVGGDSLSNLSTWTTASHNASVTDKFSQP